MHYSNPFSDMRQQPTREMLERENRQLRAENERLRKMAYLTIKLPRGLKGLSRLGVSQP